MTEPRGTGPLEVEAEFRMNVEELSRSCRCSAELIVELVHEGALDAAGPEPRSWRFDSSVLERALCAVRLASDLQVNPPGVALALQLLERIRQLEAALRDSRS